MKATLPVFFPKDEEQPWGWQDPRQWDAYGRWMQENGLLKRPPVAARALTNEFLPGAGAGSRRVRSELTPTRPDAHA